MLLLSDREVALPNIRFRWSSERAKLRCAGSALGAMGWSFSFLFCSCAGVAEEGDDDHSQPIITYAHVVDIVVRID